MPSTQAVVTSASVGGEIVTLVRREVCAPCTDRNRGETYPEQCIDFDEFFRDLPPLCGNDWQD